MKRTAESFTKRCSGVIKLNFDTLNPCKQCAVFYMAAEAAKAPDLIHAKSPVETNGGMVGFGAVRGVREPQMRRNGAQFVGFADTSILHFPLSVFNL